MKPGFKGAIVALILLLCFSVGLNISFAVNKNAEPGSEEDPIVSKSYVDAVFAQLSSKIQSLVEQNESLKKQNETLTSRLTEQEKEIKTLKDELAKVKSGSAATGNSGNAGTGSNNSNNSGTKTPAATTGTSATTGKGIVNVDVLNVRQQTNTTSKILVQVVKNETLTIVSKHGDWYKITTSKGVTGYVMAKFVTVKN